MGTKFVTKRSKTELAYGRIITVGSLYAGLKRLALEGSVQIVRTERAGNFPERQIYEATSAGREALEAERDEALRTILFRPDPFDLALVHAGSLPAKRLTNIISDRRDMFRAKQSFMEHQLQAADQWLSEAERMVLRHNIARLAAEVRWHTALLPQVGAMTAGNKKS